MLIRDGRPVVYLMPIAEYDLCISRLGTAYSAMTADEERERDATEWTEANTLNLDDDA